MREQILERSVIGPQAGDSYAQSAAIRYLDLLVAIAALVPEFGRHQPTIAAAADLRKSATYFAAQNAEINRTSRANSNALPTGSAGLKN